METVNEAVTIYLDENGKKITAAEYRRKQGVSANTEDTGAETQASQEKPKTPEVEKC